MTFAATILTLYPEMFPGSLGMSLAGRALERGDWSCETVQMRDFGRDCAGRGMRGDTARRAKIHTSTARGPMCLS